MSISIADVHLNNGQTNYITNASGNLWVGDTIANTVGIQNSGSLTFDHARLGVNVNQASTNNLLQVINPSTTMNLGYMELGNNSSGNRVVVQYGGKIDMGSGTTQLGGSFNGGSSADNIYNNSLQVSGLNSIFSGGLIRSGVSGKNMGSNSIAVSSGAVITSTGVQLGVGSAGNDTLTISSGGKLYITTATDYNTKGILSLGNGSRRNSFVLSDQGSLAVITYISLNPTLNNTNGYGDNTIMVRNAGQLKVTDQLQLDRYGVVTVQSGGLLSVSNALTVGVSNGACQLLVDGAVSSANLGSLLIGSNASATYNAVTISGGASLTSSNMTIGSRNNTINISGGSLSVFNLTISSEYNTITVTNRGQLSVTGSGSFSSSTALIIDGSGSSANLAGLAIQSGGFISVKNGALLSGPYLSAYYNFLTVDGPGSSASVTAEMDYPLSPPGVTVNQVLITGSTNRNAGTTIRLTNGASLGLGLILGESAQDESCLVFSNADSSTTVNLTSVTVGKGSGSVYNSFLLDTNTYSFPVGMSGITSLAAGVDGAASNAMTNNLSSLSLTGIVLGSGGGADSNSITLLGGGTISVSGNVSVGNGGSWNRMTLSNGTTLSASYVTIGSQSTGGVAGSSNSILVTGSSTLTAGGLTVTNSDGTLAGAVVIDGTNSRMILGELILDSGLSSSNGIPAVTLTNGGGLTVTDSLRIGVATPNNGMALGGGSDQLQLQNNLTLGSAPTSGNNFLILSNNALLNTPGELDIGISGSHNSVIFSDGARASVGTYVTLGFQVGSSNNSLTLSGTNTMLDVGNALYVGQSGSGNVMALSNGATLISSYGFIGGYASSNFAASNNSVLLTGNGTLWSNSRSLNVGNYFSITNRTNGSNSISEWWGSGNSLTIENGAQVIAGSLLIESSSSVSIPDSANPGSLIIGSLDGTGTLSLGSSTLTVGGSGSSTQFAGGLSGSGLIRKEGNGVLYLSLSNAYTGMFQIGAGTLAGNTASIRGNVTNNGTLWFEQSGSGTYSGGITGPGTFLKEGAGSLTLVWNQDYYGETRIMNGSLVLPHANSLYNSTNVTIGPGARLVLGGTEQSLREISGAGVITTATSPVTLTLRTDSMDALFTGSITGDISLVKRGIGVMALTGSNSYTGSTMITDGILDIASTDSLPRWNSLNGWGVYSDSGLAVGPLVNNADTATILASGNFARNSYFGFDTAGTNRTYSGVISNTSYGPLGLLKLGAGTLVLGGSNSYSYGTVIYGGSVAPSFSSSFGSGTIITVSNSSIVPTASLSFTNPLMIQSGVTGTLLISQNLKTVWEGALYGDGTLVKTGTGTLDLSRGTGAVSLSGGMFINAGTILAAASRLSLQNDITIAGNSLLLIRSTVPSTMPTALAGQGSLSVDAGSSTITLSGSNSYSGGTSILTGTLAGDLSSLHGSFRIMKGSALLLTSQGSGTLGLPVTGLGGFTKAGSGTLTLSSSASYTGTTTIDSGTLIMSSPLVGNIINNGSLVMATSGGSYSGTISGPGNIFFTGMLTLTGTNAGTGTIILSDSILQMRGRGRLGSAPIAVSPTSLIDLGGTSQSLGTVSLSGGTLASGSFSSTHLRLDGANNALVSAGVTGNGSLTMEGQGTLLLTGLNSYTGGTLISSGTLAGTSSSLIGAIRNDATLLFIQTGSGTFSGSVTGTGTLVMAGTGTLILSRPVGSSGGIIISSGTLSGNSSSIRGDILDNSTLLFNQTGTGTFSGLVSGTGMVVKSGSGTLLLAGTNATAGGTLITGGTLRLAGANRLASSSPLSLSGGILDLTGVQLGIGTITQRGGTITGGGISPALYAVDGSGSSTLSSALSGSGILRKTGSGTLLLSADNSSFSGSGTVTSGILRLAPNSRLGGSWEIIAGAGLNMGAGASLSTPSRVIVGGSLMDGSGLAFNRSLAGGVDLREGGTIAKTYAAGSSLAGFSAAFGTNSGFSILAGKVKKAARVTLKRVVNGFDLHGTAPNGITIAYQNPAFTPSGHTIQWWNTNAPSPYWTNTVAGNTGNVRNASFQDFNGSYQSFLAFLSSRRIVVGPGLANIMGAYGYDSASQTAWAVINHNSLFGTGLGLGPMASRTFPQMSVYPDFTSYAATPNQRSMAVAMNRWASTSVTGDKAVVLASLSESTSAKAYQSAYESLMPTMYQSMATLAFNQANAQNQELVQRLYGVRLSGSGFSMSGFADNTAMIQELQGDEGMKTKNDILQPGPDNRWSIFVDGNGIFAQANSANMLPSYNAQGGGVTAGLSYGWNDRITTGLYAGYEGTCARYTGGSRLVDNAVRFGGFGTFGAKDGRGFYADALAGGGYNNYSVTRNISLTGINRTADSSPGAGELDTMIAGGYNLRRGNWNFGPISSLQYTYLGVNGFSETGAQSLDLSNQGWNASSMISSLGANVAYTWQASRNLTMVPQISLSWQHEFLQNPYAINSSIGGAGFTNWSATPIMDTLYTGVGVTLEFDKKWNTSFFYNAAAGNSDLVSQNIFWSAGLKF